ncbi:MAG: response regulator [Casimicrobiaceae bacterium]
MATVLVIDDDVGFAQGLAACLRARHYRTIVEANGDAALVMLAGRGVDAVLCDIVMPGLLGPGFLQKAQSVPGQEQLPVIFMSTLPEERVSRMFDGYAAYLRKPFTIPEAIATIERAIVRPRRGATPLRDTGSPLSPLPPLHSAAMRRRS